MNPCLISWNVSSWAEFPCKTDISDFFFFLCACSHHTDWPVICESPTAQLIIHDGPAMEWQHSIWIIKHQAKHINGWQTGCLWPGARVELERHGFPIHSPARTGNTSVAQGRFLPSTQCMALLETNVALQHYDWPFQPSGEKHKRAVMLKSY